MYHYPKKSPWTYARHVILWLLCPTLQVIQSSHSRNTLVPSNLSLSHKQAEPPQKNNTNWFSLAIAGLCSGFSSQKNAQNPQPTTQDVQDHTTQVYEYIDAGGEPNDPDKLGRTLLHEAIYYGKLDIVKHLLEHHAHTWVQDHEGNTPLHMLVKSRRLTVEMAVEMAQLLLTNGADPNARNYEGHTPLHEAALAEALPLVQELLAYEGIDVNAESHAGVTPLMLAVIEGHNTEVVQALLADPDIRPNTAAHQTQLTALHFAAKVGDPEILELLLAHERIQPELQSHNDKTAFHIAAERGHLEAVEVLLRWIDPRITNNLGETVLHTAAKKGYSAIIHLLLDDGRVSCSAINRKGESPLHLAARKESEASVFALLRCAHIDLDAQDNKGNTACHHLAAAGQHASLFHLLQQGADPNKLNHNGETPLHRAIKEGQELIIRTLLRHEKVDPNVRNKLGRSVIHYAALLGDLTSTKLLRKWGARINKQDLYGNTALHLAAKKDHFAVCEFLTKKYFINQDLTNNRGRTALHEAAARAHFKIVACLDRPATPILDEDNNSPLDLAQQQYKRTVLKSKQMRYKRTITLLSQKHVTKKRRQSRAGLKREKTWGSFPRLAAH